MDFLVLEGVDFCGVLFAAAEAAEAAEEEGTVLEAFVVSGVETADGAEDELGLAIDILMTMVVFGFPHHASTISPRQQKTVQKISVN